jgi:hypothetical protein
MARLGPLVLLLGLLGRCGGGSALHTGPTHIIAPVLHAGPARHVILAPGAHRIFRPGALRPGDVVTCGMTTVHIPNHRFGVGWAIGKGSATRAGKSHDLELQSGPDGSVTAACSG